MHRFVRLPDGTFDMGSDVAYPEEAPRHQRTVGAFRISEAPVTNLQFGRFVVDTGYLTIAERHLSDSAGRGLPEELRGPGSVVFVPPNLGDDVGEGEWWRFVFGACWHAPLGPTSSIADKPDHPAVHIALADAIAYCDWSGTRLPSEAEWEFAARSGHDSAAKFAWGDELMPSGRQMANHWLGEFPSNPAPNNLGTTSAVGAFPANELGIVDMIGNVWEWTDDWYADHGLRVAAHKAAGGGCAIASPRGASRVDSIDTTSQHGTNPRKVVKGGSFLCTPSYCRRYRPAARMAQGIDTSTCHMGFRCIVRS